MNGAHRLHAIFSSLQGEGRNSGRPATFIRYASCNLSCRWCDTRRNELACLTTDEVVRQVCKFGNRSVVVTGGEPTIQPGLDDLLRALRAAGMWIALETNGVVAPAHPELFDYIATSPKPDALDKYVEGTMISHADEVRIVATTDEIASFCRTMRQRIAATDYYISPLDKDGRMHYRRACRLLKRLNALDPAGMPPWSLSIQMHKVLGIR